VFLNLFQIYLVEISVTTSFKRWINLQENMSVIFLLHSLCPFYVKQICFYSAECLRLKRLAVPLDQLKPAILKFPQHFFLCNRECFKEELLCKIAWWCWGLKYGYTYLLLPQYCEKRGRREETREKFESTSAMGLTLHLNWSIKCGQEIVSPIIVPLNASATENKFVCNLHNLNSGTNINSSNFCFCLFMAFRQQKRQRKL
jgi:hypothetical protein